MQLYLASNTTIRYIINITPFALLDKGVVKIRHSTNYVCIPKIVMTYATSYKLNIFPYLG